MKSIESCKPMKLRVNPREHFLVSALKRQFDFGVLTPLYIYASNNIDSLARHIEHEFTTGRSTVVYSIDNESVINLITGWSGNRSKKYTL